MNVKKVIYTAAVVENSAEKDFLKQFAKDPNIYCHHMTVEFGNLDEIPDYVGQRIEVELEDLVIDKDAVLVTVRVLDDVIAVTMINRNQQPHITVSCANGIKPSYSNDILRRNAWPSVERICNNFGQRYMLTLRLGAYCVFEDGTTGWVF